MASKMAEQIDQALLNLLTQGILQINEGIDFEISNYIDKAIMLARASGSHPLQVIINSPGGSLSDSLMIHDILRSYEGGTTGIVIGESMSGANLILQGCEVRIATFGSFLMVHELTVPNKLNILRDKRKFQEHLDFFVGLQNKVYRIYQNRTGKSRRELGCIFKKGKTLTAEMALEYGFLDKVINPEDLVIKTKEDEEEIQLDFEQIKKLFKKSK